MNDLKRSPPLFLLFVATLGNASCSPGDVSSRSGPAATAQASGQAGPSSTGQNATTAQASGQTGPSSPGQNATTVQASGQTGPSSTGQNATTAQASGQAGPSSTGQNAASIASAVAKGVGEVTRTSPVQSGSPIILLEERHNSLVGQIQHAIVLTRLHERHGLNAIVLEGYLQDDPEINTDWFTKSVRPRTPEARASVAVRALARGDISAVEFTKLVYPDVVLYRADKPDNYFVDPPSSFPPLPYLKKIATKDLQWAKKHIALYQDGDGFLKLSGDKKLKFAREIKQYAEALGVVIDPKDANAMRKYINFFDKRMLTNQTIATTLSDALNKDARHPIAANFGTDHSAGVASLLDEKKQSYAFICPRYISDNKEKGDLGDEMYDRRNKRLPVFAKGAFQLLLEAESMRKPQQTLTLAWAQANAELAGMVDSVMHAIPRSVSGLPPGKDHPKPPGSGGKPPGSGEKPPGPGGKPPGPGGKPPFGLLDEDYDGKRIKILLSGIEVVQREDGQSAGVIIPVLFKDTGRKLYIGARLRAGQELGNTQSAAETPKNMTVEEIEEAALREVEKEERPPERLEDQTGAIDLGANVSAVIGTDPEKMKQRLLSNS